MNKIKIYRTPEGTLFEALSAVLFVLSIVLALRLLDGDTLHLILVSNGVLGAAAALLLVFAYHPDSQWVNTPVPLRNRRQKLMTTRLLRVVALELVANGLAQTILHVIDNETARTTGNTVFIVVLVVTLAVYTFFIQRVRHDRDNKT